MINKTYKDPFRYYMKIDKKSSFYDFVRWAIHFHQKVHGYPKKIVVNGVDLPKLANAKTGTIDQVKIPIETAKNCLPNHVQFY